MIIIISNSNDDDDDDGKCWNLFKLLITSLYQCVSTANICFSNLILLYLHRYIRV